MSGEAVRGIQEARAILRGRHGSLDALGKDYVEYATAAAVLVDHYKANPEELRPAAAITLRDAEFDRPRYTTRDASAQIAEADQQHEVAAMMRSGWLSAWRDQGATEVGQPAGGASPGGITPGANASGKVGAKLIQRLPGPASAYFIQADGDGNACLYQSADITDLGDTMQTAIQDGRVRALFELQAARSKAQLRRINEANRAFWGKHQR